MSLRKKFLVFLSFCFIGSALYLPAQENTTPQKTDVRVPAGSAYSRKGDPSERAPAVRIGPGDELEITVYGAADLNERARVDEDGDISMPLLGGLHVGGLSSSEAQTLVEKRLTEANLIKHPHVNVFVREYGSEGISVIGEVNKPGVYSALTTHRLYDMIQTAGGFTVRAGKTVTISHRSNPQQPSTLELSNDPVHTAADNIELSPGDTVVVSRAGVVYVLGEVNRPGGFVMENDQMTALQALALAAGPTRIAAFNGAKLVRRTSTGLKQETIPLKSIMNAKSKDLPLQPDDIIYVPGSKLKASLTGTAQIASSAASAAIYRY